MQPFPENYLLQESPAFWFKPGQKWRVKVFADVNNAVANGPGLSKCGELLATGTMTLRVGVFVDSETMNADPLKRVEKVVL